MLILTRRPGQTLHIGDNITVTVLGSQGDQVRLGITAPDDVAIHRSEIYQQIGNVRPVPPAELVEAWNREHPAPALIEYRPYRGAEPQRTRTGDIGCSERNPARSPGAPVPGRSGEWSERIAVLDGDGLALCHRSFQLRRRSAPARPLPAAHAALPLFARLWPGFFHRPHSHERSPPPHRASPAA